MDLGHQGAGGIEDRQSAGRGFLFDAPGDAMGAEHRHGQGRHFGQVFDEDSTLVFEAFYDVFVMDDLMTHIDRGAVLLQRALDDLDRTHHAGTKSARLCKIDFHGTPVTHVALNSRCIFFEPGIGSRQHVSASILFRSARRHGALWQKKLTQKRPPGDAPASHRRIPVT